jgi:anthranilate synthase/aminodeoxychorismate synthase-like glutamine amidotransferase
MKKIIVIDNYDSFTWNLYQYLAELGANVKVFRNDKITIQQLEKISPDAVVISPGPCTPKEAGISVELIKKLAGKTPILGVCLGHQCIGAAFGGEIVRAKKLMHGKTSEIIHLNGSKLFSGVSQGFVAGRYHSLVVRQESLPKELVITAISTDDGEIMGVRHKEFFVEGIQFHPESILTKAGKDILKNFLDCL